FRGRVKTRLLERAARESLKHEGQAPGTNLTIVITNDANLRRLNEQFLRMDAPTDVLSFPAGDIDPDTGEPYLGDVLISFPRAEAQAESAGHQVEEEVQLLVTHGILHLLGYDHAEPEGEKRMWRVQEEILEALRGSRGPGG
ncbi:MAG TPA: rRNA maturation RNase YbeY, partial [Anaerolineales bacterium]|nr:rRNA maturation RNase YbeY [Anaerolineales bacterium]